MATYFPSFRQRRQAVEEPVASTSSADATPRVEEDLRWMANTSILIFPSPSSSFPSTPASQAAAALPGSPASGSGSLSSFSIPTSISVDSNLESSVSSPAPRRIHLRRRNGSTNSSRAQVNSPSGEARWQHHALGMDLESASEATEPDVEVWEWSSFPSSSHQDIAFPTHSPDDIGAWHVESWASHLRARTTSQWTQSSDATNATRLTHFSHSTLEKERIITQPAVNFPFLSTILRLLGVDKESVVLLGTFGSTTIEAELFPCSPFDVNRRSEVDGEEKREERNPVIALLTRSDDPTHSLRTGLHAAAEYGDGVMITFPPIPFGIQDIILSPITLTKAIANGASDAVCYSSSAVGSIVGSVTRPLFSGWRRAEVVTSS